MSNKRVTLPIFTVDAFTSSAFSGNPAAVCLPGKQELMEEDMRQIASEMNLSETAFVTLRKPSDCYTTSCEFSLRWFTPSHEVKLCGHATLASATVLFRCMGNKSQSLVFCTLSGTLLASRKSRVDDVITLNFPLNVPTSIDSKELQDTVTRLVKLIFRKESVELIDTQYSASTNKVLLRLQDCPQPKQLLGTLKPNFGGMVEEDSGWVKGVIVTCRASSESEGEVDFYSRYFAPWLGINEDPVTGSAHTVLAPYWATIMRKDKFNAVQCSKRGGQLEVECLKENRCALRGQAVVVLEGLIYNPSTTILYKL